MNLIKNFAEQSNIDFTSTVHKAKVDGRIIDKLRENEY